MEVVWEVAVEAGILALVEWVVVEVASDSGVGAAVEALRAAEALLAPKGVWAWDFGAGLAEAEAVATVD